MQVRMSWVEQFMNWYPRNTKLYRRRSKADPTDLLTGMKAEFDELKRFFLPMADTIWNKAQLAERERWENLCQAILVCNTIEEAKAMTKQAVLAVTPASTAL